MDSFFFFVSDDDNRLKLKPIGGRPDCHHDYINASYVDVSMHAIVMGVAPAKCEAREEGEANILIYGCGSWSVCQAITCAKVANNIQFILTF